MVFLLASNCAMAQVCATPQKDGSKTTGSGEVVNGYYTPANGNYIAGTLPTIALSNARGTTTVFARGDMALIIQMQCVGLNMTDTDSYGDGVAGFPGYGYLETSGTCKAGQCEYVPAGVGTSPGSFVAGAALQNTYVQADPTISTPRRSFQIIRFPQYANLTLGGPLNGLSWDGLNGGITALDVAKNTNFAGQTFFLAAQGFRGAGGRQSGAINGNNPYRYNDGPGVAHASKAEGIAGTPPLLFTDGSPFDRVDTAGTVTLDTGTLYGYPGNTGTVADFNYAKGAPGNAGGGGQYRDGSYHNGGWSGGNGGASGRGGFGWRSTGWAGVASDFSNIVAVTGDHLAAFGGGAFGGASVSRVPLGGGDGAGDQNGNSNNTRELSGGTGGGLLLIRSGSLSGNGTVDLRGGVANSNPLNDAAGGGAAGGSAVIISPNWTTGVLTVNAAGGQAGDAWVTGATAHSGGGGRGGGVVYIAAR